MTSMRPEDVIHTLKNLQLLKYQNDPIEVSLMPGMIEFHLLSTKYIKPRLNVERSAIQWTHPNNRCEQAAESS